MRYIVRESEAGNDIDSFDTLDKAIECIRKYERQDKEDGTYVVGFYEVYDSEVEGIVY